MKRLAVLLSCAVLLSTGVRADDWKFETGFDYLTEYIFRGVDVSKNQPLYEPRWYDRMLHNDTAYFIQRRLRFAGVPVVILPIRLFRKGRPAAAN